MGAKTNKIRRREQSQSTEEEIPTGRKNPGKKGEIVEK